MTTVLGCDPSLTSYGWAVVGDGLATFETGQVKTYPRYTLGTRLLKIRRELTEVVVRRKPELLVVENMVLSRVKRTAETMKAIGASHAVAYELAAEHGIAVLVVEPAEVKRHAVGVGVAEKIEMQSSALRWLGITVGPDAADAAWMASLGKGVLDEWLADFPAANRKGISAQLKNIIKPDEPKAA